MSRCFPYPPPGFETNLALIESIKLQKEKEKAKKQRKKEKKREKEEKKEKSVGEKEKTEAEKHNNRKRHHAELSQSTHKSGDFTKTREDENEQLERSSVTEEEGAPSVVQTLYDSSDSTRNTGKRSKHESAGVSQTPHGTGLRIRLPLSRHKDTVSPISGNRPCFSGRTETVSLQQPPNKTGRIETVPVRAQQRPKPGRTGGTVPIPAQQEPKPGRTGGTVPIPAQQQSKPGRTGGTVPIPAQQQTKAGRTERVPAQQAPKAIVHHHAPLSAEQPCFSGRTGTKPPKELHESSNAKPASVEAGTVHSSGGGGGSSSGSHDREMRRVYKKLILEWNPPPLQTENPEVDDQDWLFGERRHHGQGEVKAEQAASEDDAGLGSAFCAWPPRARFLPEVGIHALPYVVPF